MKVTIGSWAWVDRRDLSFDQLELIKRQLTVQPRKVGDHPGEAPGPIQLYVEHGNKFGMAREYYLARRKAEHVVEWDVTSGDRSTWPGNLEFCGELRDEQMEAKGVILAKFSGGTVGGILRASPGWGKTVEACALIADLQIPTLVVVHKEFLVNQWRERIEQFLPNARVGVVQQDRCEFEGMHVIVGMVHSLAGHAYPDALWKWPGLVITDEVHRIGAETWSAVPPRFAARFRLGISATPRRKDRADDVFLLHIGPVLFSAKERRMTPKIRRVWTKFKLIKTPRFNPELITKTMLVSILVANDPRNRVIAEQLVQAVRAGRKILVLSDRLQHLDDLNLLLREMWTTHMGSLPSVGFFVGGRSESQLDDAAECTVVFATSQMAAEALDIPPLDTLFLTTPMADVEQAVGRILRPSEGKKEPIVVDFRDDLVEKCERLGALRDKYYASLGV